VGPKIYEEECFTLFLEQEHARFTIEREDQAIKNEEISGRTLPKSKKARGLPPEPHKF